MTITKNIKNKIKSCLIQVGLYTSKEDRLKKSPFFQAYPSELPIKNANKVIKINHNYKYAYFEIPKAASSTIIYNLYHTETGHTVEMGKDKITAKTQFFHKPASLSEAQLRNLINQYFKFSIVRNPYTRFLSAFYQKIHDTKRYRTRRQNLANYLGIKYESEITVADFLKYLEDIGLYEDFHWAPQNKILVMPNENFDFVGKIENLDEDLRFIMTRIFNNDWHMVNWQKHSTNANTKINTLDKKTAGRIYKLYEEDFDQFRYVKELPF